MRNYIISICLLVLCCLGLSAFDKLASTNNTVELGRGISIGNALDAPKGEYWGVEMKKEYLNLISEAGFDTVRMPVRFSDYFDKTSGKIDNEFLKLIDQYVEHGLSLGLNVILDLHHFTELMQSPEENRNSFMGIWRQLSERYMNYPSELVFEILNEPRDKLKGELWNQYLGEVIPLIREKNPNRLIIVGGDRFNSLGGLDRLELPQDINLAVTFHYYRPLEFAFQGNPHHEGFEHLNDVKWIGSDDEISKIRKDFQKVRDWALENDVQVFLGEFGAVKTIPFEYRGKWTSTITDIAEEMGFSWCYWELCSWFGILDPVSQEWDYDMLNILLQR